MDNIEDILRALAEDAPEDSGSKDEVSQDGGLFSGLDLGSMAKIAGLLSAAGNTSDDEKLLMALKPLLREENRGKVDTAMRLLKLIERLPLLKESGIFGKLGSGIVSSLRFTARWSPSIIPRASRRKIPLNVSAGKRNAEPHRKSENAALNSRGNAPLRPETSEEFCKS